MYFIFIFVDSTQKKTDAVRDCSNERSLRMNGSLPGRFRLASFVHSFVHGRSNTSYIHLINSSYREKACQCIGRTDTKL